MFLLYMKYTGLGLFLLNIHIIHIEICMIPRGTMLNIGGDVRKSKWVCVYVCTYKLLITVPSDHVVLTSRGYSYLMLPTMDVKKDQ